jgi:hypothetical protein
MIAGGVIIAEDFLLGHQLMDSRPLAIIVGVIFTTLFARLLGRRLWRTLS